MMEISTLDTHYEKENTLDVTEYVEGKKKKKKKENVPYVDDIPIQKKSRKIYGKKSMDGLVKHIEKWEKVKDWLLKRKEFLEKQGGSIAYAYEKIYGC